MLADITQIVDMFMEQNMVKHCNAAQCTLDLFKKDHYVEMMLAR